MKYLKEQKTKYFADLDIARYVVEYEITSLFKFTITNKQNN